MENGLHVLDPMDHEVCQVFCIDGDEESEANARLIAASPVLLKACKKALEDKAAQYADTFDSRMDHDETVIALRAALAQARDGDQAG